MKKVTAIFFLIIIATAVFSKVVVMVDYVLNKQYIATVLCENKAKPMMHCNGKCHLKKQLQKEEEQQKKEGQDSQQKFEVQFCNTTSINVDYYNYNSSLSHVIVYNNHYNFDSITSIFHPPLG